MLNLDTHILLHALAGSLSAREEKILSSEAWGISDIVLWEITKLSKLKRIELDLKDSEAIRALSKIHVWPIDLQICRAILTLDFSGDPADEIVAATSIVHKSKLVTRDKQILRSKKVPLV